MILDYLLRFSDAQIIPATATTSPSTNVIDFGLGTAANPAIPSNANGGGARDMGIGDNPALKLLVQVKALAASAGAGTLTVKIAGAPDDGTGAPGAYTVWWTSPAYTVAQLNAGSRLLDMDFPRPPDGVAMPRFVELQYTTTTAGFEAGTLDAFIVIDRDDQPYNGTDNSVMGGYPAGLTVAN